MADLVASENGFDIHGSGEHRDVETRHVSSKASRAAPSVQTQSEAPTEKKDEPLNISHCNSFFFLNGSFFFFFFFLRVFFYRSYLGSWDCFPFFCFFFGNALETLSRRWKRTPWPGAVRGQDSIIQKVQSWQILDI